MLLFRNKDLMLEGKVLELLGKMIVNRKCAGAATALYLNLSCLEEAKPIIGSSEAVPFLIQVLQHQPDVQCRLDSLHALYNLSGHQAKISPLLSAGVIDSLQALFTNSGDHSWTENSIAVVIKLAAS